VYGAPERGTLRPPDSLPLYIIDVYDAPERGAPRPLFHDVALYAARDGKCLGVAQPSVSA